MPWTQAALLPLLHPLRLDELLQGFAEFGQQLFCELKTLGESRGPQRLYAGLTEDIENSPLEIGHEGVRRARLISIGWHWRLVRQCLCSQWKGSLADEPPVPPGFHDVPAETPLYSFRSSRGE